MRQGRMEQAERSGSPRDRRKRVAADRAVSQLRRAFFANAGERAARYQITFDGVLLHLWRSRRVGAPPGLRSIAHLDDLVHAVACVANVDRAWADLAEQNEAALMRVVRRQLDEMESIVFVRKLLAELRLQRAQTADRRAPSLAGYRGTQPLRAWLVDRTLGRLAQAVVMQAAQVRSRRQDRLDGTSVRLSPALLALDDAEQPQDSSSLHVTGPMTLEPGA